MHRLFFGRTVIIIAHRLQTVKEADDIIVIEN
jgi:ABC-type multidrug transport system fused ATPase/permease subunit